MGYQALLFCPDEKLARVVSQVFTELDFSVEPVHEPFAAVKKLMSQRYDAIVVDCENEQNASLLFKSARNSSFNQSSLAIALVEGQAGVAKAYRIGANLVLTKPINVEQAKGTLRVARGLLRKNSDAAGASASSQTPASTPAKTSNASGPAPVSGTSQPPSRPVTTAAPLVDRAALPEFEMPVTPPAPAALPAIAASAKIEETPVAVSAPPAPIHAAVAPEPVVEVRQPAFPLVPRSPAIGDIVKNDATHQLNDVPAKPAVPVPMQNTATAFQSVPGSAAAVAPAKEATAPPAKDTKTVEMGHAEVSGAKAAPVSATAATAYDAVTTNDGPSFAALDDGDPEGSAGKKKIFIGVAALLALALAGYFGYQQWGKPAGSTPASHPASVPQNSSEPAPALAPMSAPMSTPSTSIPGRASSATPGANTKPATVAALDRPSAVAGSSPAIRIDATPEPEAKKPAAAPIVVKSNAGAGRTQSQAEEAAPSLPSTVASANDSSLSSLISSAPSTVARPSLATIKVSQGVSQGLVIKRVQPKYPPSSLSAHSQGAVQIEATIDKEGNVTNLKVLKGDPILAKAALDAVRQWRYKPYYLDGEPVEIQTQITVNFKAN